jgi:amino acid transporter
MHAFLHLSAVLVKQFLAATRKSVFSALPRAARVLQLLLAFCRRRRTRRSKGASLLSTAANLPAATSVSIPANRALRKELGFTDLVFACVLMVVIPDFYGSAVKAGPSHVFLWILAIVFFFLPQAFVVSHLNRKLPLEGGLYEWARVAFGDMAGFLVAWNLWMYVVLYVASIGLVTTNYLSYALGPDFAWIATSRKVLLITTLLIVGGLMLLTHYGLHIGKWVTNAGSFLTVLVLAVLIALPFIRHTQGAPADFHPFRFAWPALNIFSLSVFSKMTFGALCGLEYVAIFSGESQNPVRHLPRAILLAVPLIAVLYIFGTSAILAFVSPDKIDLIGPIPQALQAGFAGLSAVKFIVPVSILLLLTNYLSSFSLNFAANTRLPMVAGWDRLLPAWFTKLHPKFRTPVNSILFLGAITVAASLAVLIGVHEQEAFEMLQIWGFAFYGLAYLALFAIPMLARKDSQLRAGVALRIAASSGLLLTLLFVVLSIVPIVDVSDKTAYMVKTIALLVGANAVALLLFKVNLRRQRAQVT